MRKRSNSVVIVQARTKSCTQRSLASARAFIPSPWHCVARHGPLPTLYFVATPGLCRHCGGVVPLCDAHIWPRSWYDLSNPHKIISQLEKTWPQAVRKGFWDDSFICSTCDGQYGNDETYTGQQLQRFLFQTIGVPHQGIEDLRELSVDGLRIRRAILFLLWKMMHARHQMFAALRFAPYVDRLRAAMDNPARPGFEIFIAYYSDFPMTAGGCLLQEPQPTRLNGTIDGDYRHVVMIPINRCLIYINVDSRSIHRPFVDFVVSPTRLFLVPTTCRGSGLLASAKTIVEQNANAFR